MRSKWARKIEERPELRAYDEFESYEGTKLKHLCPIQPVLVKPPDNKQVAPNTEETNK